MSMTMTTTTTTTTTTRDRGDRYGPMKWAQLESAQGWIAQPVAAGGGVWVGGGMGMLFYQHAQAVFESD